jgi:ketosteroid isomerase-like protein
VKSPRTLAAPITAVCLLAVGAVSVTAQQSVSTTENDVRAVVSAFRTALNEGDSTTVVRLLHPDARIYEGGHAETREEYRSGHLHGDIAFLQAVESETISDHVVIADDLALYMREDRKTGESRGREIDSHGTETIVLVPTPDGWRIRHIHWSSR